MDNERLPHDAAYKQFFSNRKMVESLLRDFVPADFVEELDFTTLERYSGSFVTDDLRERHDDIIWRIGWKNGSWCYVSLLLEFQSTPDTWMALRVLSYTSLLLLDLVKTGKVHEGEGLPPVFPIVIYNGNRVWKAPLEIGELFAPMHEDLKAYCPQHRYFLLDESRVPAEKLKNLEGLVPLLLRFERIREPADAREILEKLIELLKDPENLSLRRAFTEWCSRILFKRSGFLKEPPEFQDLQEVNAMLEERAAQWIDEYRAEGEAKGRVEGKAEGRVEGRAEIVQKLMQLGQLSLEAIAQISGFTVEELKQIQAGFKPT